MDTINIPFDSGTIQNDSVERLPINKGYEAEERSSKRVCVANYAQPSKEKGQTRLPVLSSACECGLLCAHTARQYERRETRCTITPRRCKLKHAVDLCILPFSPFHHHGHCLPRPLSTPMPMNMCPVRDRRRSGARLLRPIQRRIRHLRVRMHLLQVCLVPLRRGLDSRLAGVPIRRKHFPVFICELEGVDEAEGFVYAAADREVVDCDLCANG